MRKAFALAIVLLLLTTSLFAAKDPFGDSGASFGGLTTDNKTFRLDIGGFIGEYSYLQIITEPFISAQGAQGQGMNLDYADPNNNSINRYLITPTEDPLTEAGIEIANLYLIVTSDILRSTGAKLTISHTPLIHTEQPNVTVDYELAFKYALSDGISIADPDTEICFSSNSILTANPNYRKIVVELFSSIGAVSIRDASLYFRLTKDSSLSVDGQYFSTVSVSLEAI